MKTTNLMKKLVLYPGLWLLQGTPLWAAEVAGREDNSGLFVWIFLGFCALIIVAQLIPALLVLFGFAKGVKREKAESGMEVYSTLEGDTMYLISQRYGIKLKSLYKMNRMQEDTEPETGSTIWLRNIKPVN